VNLHINNNKQTLLEKTCKRILSYNFYLVIHLFIYLLWMGGGKKRSCLAYSLLLLQTMIYCSKQKPTKMSFSILFYFAAYKGLDSCMFLSALLVGCCLLDFQHFAKVILHQLAMRIITRLTSCVHAFMHVTLIVSIAALTLLKFEIVLSTHRSI